MLQLPLSAAKAGRGLIPYSVRSFDRRLICPGQAKPGAPGQACCAVLKDETARCSEPTDQQHLVMGAWHNWHVPPDSPTAGALQPYKLSHFQRNGAPGRRQVLWWIALAIWQLAATSERVTGSAGGRPSAAVVDRPCRLPATRVYCTNTSTTYLPASMYRRYVQLY